MTPLFSDFLEGRQPGLAWLVDLAAHWQWLYVVGLLGAVGFLLTVRWRYALWLLALPLPWVTVSEPAPSWRLNHAAASSTLKITTANVHFDSTDAAPLLRWLEQTQPDVVVLLEVSPAYAAQLEGLPSYPYRHLVPRPTPFGLAVLSRLPFDRVQTRTDDHGIDQIDSVIRWNDQKLKLTAWHPMPPIEIAFHARRNEQLRGLADEARLWGQPAIVAGDLNATPWSSAFSHLSEAGLRRASGLLPTWPALGRGWLGIPIDHVLVSPHWAVIKSELGPDLGSDHLPVLVTLGLQK